MNEGILVEEQFPSFSKSEQLWPKPDTVFPDFGFHCQQA